MPDIAIEPYVRWRESASAQRQIDEIFFQSSAVQQFSGPAERAAFRERWLGRYLLVDGADAFLAIDPRAGRVVGYVIGAVADLAHSGRFADLASARAFAAASALYPAHLHINVDEAYRNRRIGERLIETFAGHAARAGAAGVHVVTGAASRNVRFYNRCGFTEIARLASGGGDKVFLGRAFSASGGRSINGETAR